MLLSGDSDLVDMSIEIHILVHNATAGVERTRRRSEDCADSRRALLSGDSDEVETSTDICPRSRRNCQGLGSPSRGPYRPETPLCSRRTRLSGDFDGQAKAAGRRDRSSTGQTNHVGI